MIPHNSGEEVIMMVTDPVCLNEINEETAVEKTEYRGNTYYFDTERCKDIFERDPDEYVGQIPAKVYGDHARYVRKQGLALSIPQQEANPP